MGVLNIVKCTHVIGRQIWKFSQTKFTSGFRNRAKFPKPTNPNLAAIGRITSAVNQYLKSYYLMSGISGPGRNLENLLGHLRNIIIPISKLILSCHFCDRWQLCDTLDFFNMLQNDFLFEWESSTIFCRCVFSKMSWPVNWSNLIGYLINSHLRVGVSTCGRRIREFEKRESEKRERPERENRKNEPEKKLSKWFYQKWNSKKSEVTDPDKVMMSNYKSEIR